jgi:hypothetical protein
MSEKVDRIPLSTAIQRVRKIAAGA